MTLTKLTDVTTETFQVKDNYRIDIQTTPDGYEAYIYNTMYDVKMLCVGVPKKVKRYETFLAMVSQDTNIENWIADYELDYID